MEQNESTRQHVCHFIDNWLKENGIPSLRLSKYLGVKPVSVKRWREGVCAPDIDLFPKICEFMSVSVNELLGFGGTESLTPAQEEVAFRYKDDETFKRISDGYKSDGRFRKLMGDIADYVGK